MEKNKVIENLKYVEKYMGMPEQGSTWSPNAQTKAIEEAIYTLEKIPQIISVLKYYLNTNEENGVIYKNYKSRHPYPERGQTFRASLEFDAEEDARDAFQCMVNGSKTYMDYMENYASHVIPKADFIEAVIRR